MCTTDLCNAQDYNFHTERANRLFGKPPQSEAVRSPFFPPTGSRTSPISESTSQNRKYALTIVTPSSNLVEEDLFGQADQKNDIIDEDFDSEATEEVDVVKVLDMDQERIESLWTDNIDDLLVDETIEDLTEAPRAPRQTQGKIHAREYQNTQ